MGIFSKKINVNQVANNLLDKLDDSSLTMQERAVGTIEMLERLGITPSSKTRRQVTWVLLIYMKLYSIAMAVAYYYDEAFGDKLMEIFKEYTSNPILLSIVAFFYGGYYLTKNVSPMMKEKIQSKKQKREIDLKKEEQKLHEDSVNFERKTIKRNRRAEINN